MDLNDQIMSIRTWIYDMFQGPITTVIPPYPNLMFLETEGRRRNFTRPQWSIDRLNHRVVDLGAGGFRDDCLWQLSYYGLNRNDADEVLSKVNHAVQSDSQFGKFFLRIPAYRYNWQYPQPAVLPNVVTPGPGLPAGAYNVRVSGIDICGNETVASQPLTVNLVAPNNALLVRVLRVPFGMPLFTSYNIYVNNHLEIAGLVQPGRQGVVGVYAITTLTNLIGSGKIPIELANSNPVRWKFMRVNSFADALQEDDEEDGIFNGLITMETSVFEERDRPQPDIVRSVGIGLKVNPPVPTPHVVPPNIPSSNTVIFNVSA